MPRFRTMQETWYSRSKRLEKPKSDIHEDEEEEEGNTKMSKVVVGMSGGVDCSVAACVPEGTGI